MSEILCTDIWPCDENIQHTCRKGSALTYDHARNTSNIHVRKALHLHLTMWVTNPTYMSKRICTYILPCKEPIQHTCSKGLCTYICTCEEPIQHACQKDSALTSAHGRNQSNMHVRRACTHIWSCRNQSYIHIRMAPIPRLSYLVTDQVPPFQEWNSVLISDHVGTNPTITSEWLSTHIWHGRNQYSHHDRMAQPLHLTMEGANPLTMLEWLTDSSLPFGGNLDL